MADRKSKQPSEVLDFDFDAEKRLTDGDFIVNVTASRTGPDTALTVERVTWKETVAKVWLSGGTDNCMYKVTAMIYTNNGRTIEAEFTLTVKDI